jgi:type II secretory pathway component GspD/PulD (secretin)
MLVPNGKTVFMGGLIRHSVNSSEIVGLITPRIVNYNDETPESNSLQQVETINEIIESESWMMKNKVQLSKIPKEAAEQLAKDVKN